jgi:hypothetical protein
MQQPERYTFLQTGESRGSGNAKTAQVPCSSERLGGCYRKTRPIEIFNENMACENKIEHPGTGFHSEINIEDTHIILHSAQSKLHYKANAPCLTQILQQ